MAPLAYNGNKFDYKYGLGPFHKAFTDKPVQIARFYDEEFEFSYMRTYLRDISDRNIKLNKGVETMRLVFENMLILKRLFLVVKTVFN